MKATDIISKKYNNIYKRKKKAFGDKPYPIVNDLLSFRSEGNVLDLGCGDGRNALFLARHGFSVRAIDFADSGLSKVENYALKEDLPIKVKLADIRKNLCLEDDFDIVLVTFVAQYLTYKEFSLVVRKAQRHTRYGGMHILAVIDKDSQYASLDKVQKWNFLSINDVLSLYQGWEIIKNYQNRGKILSKTDDNPIDRGEVIANNLILKKI